MQKQVSNLENERRILTERLESAQQAVADLRRVNQTLGDQNARLQNEISNNEVVRSGLEAQLRISSWPHEERTNKEDELVRQLQAAQRDRSELKGKVDALNDKVFLLQFKYILIEKKTYKYFNIMSLEIGINIYFF